MTKANCPSCGAEVSFKSKVTLYVACSYCNSLVVRNGLDLERIGTIGELHDDGTVIQLGTRGNYKGRTFEAIGRLQARYAAGWWNEWYLTFGGAADGWMGEAQGNYTISFATKIGEPIPPFAELAVGRKLRLGGTPFEVRDLESARVTGVEGELPFEAKMGYDASLADLGTADGRFATIDYSEEPPLVFIGEEAGFAELSLTHLREIEGW